MLGKQPISTDNLVGSSCTVLKAAFRIMEKWGCSSEQIQAVLQLSERDYQEFLKAPETSDLNEEQLKRVSYLLNIHASLRNTFSNPENIYGFMSLANHNPFFEGRTPLEIICEGNLVNLRNVSEQIEAVSRR